MPRRLPPEEAKKKRSDPLGALLAELAPVQVLARIAMLISPPWFRLQRFASVLAPTRSWRPAVAAVGANVMRRVSTSMRSPTPL